MSVIGSSLVNFLHVAIGSTIMILYPVVESTRLVIGSASCQHHQQWLTYWILHSLLTLLELHCSTIISWIRVWPYLKLLLCMWLVLPGFNGAAYLFENIVMKYVLFESKEKERFKAHLKKIEDEEESDDEDDEEVEDDDDEKKIFKAWRLVEDYIDNTGPDSLERIVKDGLEAERSEMKKSKEKRSM